MLEAARIRVLSRADRAGSHSLNAQSELPLRTEGRHESALKRTGVIPHLVGRSGAIPDLHLLQISAMQLVTTRDAVRLTGLSTEQLREWTNRRALIPPDVKPKGHGSPAHYSWQTILLLRLAVILRDRFKVELQAHRELFAALGAGFARTSFLTLWGKSVILRGGAEWKMVDLGDEVEIVDDCIVLQLDPHLKELSDSFALPQPAALGQFQLFPALGVAAEESEGNFIGHRKHG